MHDPADPTEARLAAGWRQQIAYGLRSWRGDDLCGRVIEPPAGFAPAPEPAGIWRFIGVEHDGINGHDATLWLRWVQPADQ